MLRNSGILFLTVQRLSNFAYDTHGLVKDMKAWPNARNISTQHLATMLHDVATVIERAGQMHATFITCRCLWAQASSALGLRPKINMEDLKWYRYRRRRIAAFSLGLFLVDDERAGISILQTPVPLSPLNGTTFQLCSKDKVAPLTSLSRTWSRLLSTSSDISFLVVEFGQYCPPWLQTKKHHASGALQ